MATVTIENLADIRVHPEWDRSPQKIAAVPDGPWVVKLTNSAAEANTFQEYGLS